MDSKQSKHRAGLILQREGKVLILYGLPNRKWSFPKGTRETIDVRDNDDLTDLHTATRETLEETGLSKSMYHIHKKRELHCFGRYFYGTIIAQGPLFLQPNEILEYGWIDLATGTLDIPNTTNKSCNSAVSMYLRLLRNKLQAVNRLPGTDRGELVGHRVMKDLKVQLVDKGKQVSGSVATSLSTPWC